MNDSEIIKGLQRMSNEGPDGFSSVVLGLIKRQQAEINRLNIDLKAMRGAANSYKAHYEDLKSENLETIKILKTAKSEAVREFVEKLKEKLKANSNYGDIYDEVAYDCIDNLTEEMGCDDE